MVDAGSQESPVRSSLYKRTRIDKLNRRGDGFSETGDSSDIFATGEPSEFVSSSTEESSIATNPGSKVESIPLETDTDTSNVVNYGYHPIIDFFNPLLN